LYHSVSKYILVLSLYSLDTKTTPQEKLEQVKNKGKEIKKIENNNMEEGLVYQISCKECKENSSSLL
jgi:hypothetical protein